MQPVVCVVGPTASGKSDLAQSIALSLNGEVVSADSMQIYKGMDIGTGKVPPDQRLVKHFGLDLVDPGSPYSASLFQEYARACFEDIGQRGKVAVLCGGTGFYVRAAIDDYQFPAGDQVDNPVRHRYTEMAEQAGGQAVWHELNRLDPRSAAVVHPHNVKRVIRALELLSEGKHYADQVEALSTLPQKVPAVFLGLQMPREELYARINARVDAMFEAGLIDEVIRLLDSGFRQGVTAPAAIGYKEVVEALDGHCSMEDAIESIKQSTRRYAKRQISWFGKDQRIMWLDASEPNREHLVGDALDSLQARGFTCRS